VAYVAAASRGAEGGEIGIDRSTASSPGRHRELRRWLIAVGELQRAIPRSTASSVQVPVRSPSRRGGTARRRPAKDVDGTPPGEPRTPRHGVAAPNRAPRRNPGDPVHYGVAIEAARVIVGRGLTIVDHSQPARRSNGKRQRGGSPVVNNRVAIWAVTRARQTSSCRPRAARNHPNRHGVDVSRAPSW